MRNLSVMEQQAQSIAIKKFYQTLVILEDFEATGALHRGIRCLYDRLRDVLDEAKSIWRAKNSKFLFFAYALLFPTSTPSFFCPVNAKLCNEHREEELYLELQPKKQKVCV